MRLDARSALRALAIFAACLLLGLALWPLAADAFSWLFRVLCALALEPLTFGQGGHVSFAAASDSATSLERAGSWDVRMTLSIEGVAEAHAIAVNPRRLLYLPLLTLLASVLAMPLSWAGRLRALLVGVPILSVVALSSVWLIALYLFSQVPGLVYDFSAATDGLVRLVYEGWVTPLTSKFMLPLLLAYGLFAWQGRRQQREPAPVTLSPSSGPARAATKPEKSKTGKRKRRKRAAGGRHS